MKQEKDTMIRLTVEMAAVVDGLIPLVEQVPELRARLEYGGKVTRSGVIRELIRLGMPILRRALPEVVAPAPVPVKPTTKKKPAPKVKKKAGRGRK
jgi:hypothetical protein